MGASLPLSADRSLMRRGNAWKHYPPAGGKLVWGDPYSEDYLRLMKEQIPTAKSGTDEQKRYMRL